MTNKSGCCERLLLILFSTSLSRLSDKLICFGFFLYLRLLNLIQYFLLLRFFLLLVFQSIFLFLLLLGKLSFLYYFGAHDSGFTIRALLVAFAPLISLTSLYYLLVDGFLGLRKRGGM